MRHWGMRILLKLVLDCDADAAWRALHSPRAVAELYAPLLGMQPLEAHPATSMTVGADVPGAGAAVLLAEAGLAPSRGEARRLVQGGAITINGERIGDPAAPLASAVDGEWLEVRVGKRNRAVVRIARA